MRLELRRPAVLLLLAVPIMLVACAGPESAPEPPTGDEAPAAPEAAAEPTPEERIAGLEQMCAGAHNAILARQAETPLYDRLGGSEAIRAVFEDVVQRHLVNEQIKDIMVGVDTANLVDKVTEFMSEATGGDVEYTGADMVTTHAHMSLTNADFLAAGGDVEAAMVAAGVGPDEIQEVMCMFVSLHNEVVMP